MPNSPEYSQPREVVPKPATETAPGDKLRRLNETEQAQERLAEAMLVFEELTHHTNPVVAGVARRDLATIENRSAELAQKRQLIAQQLARETQTPDSPELRRQKIAQAVKPFGLELDPIRLNQDFDKMFYAYTDYLEDEMDPEYLQTAAGQKELGNKRLRVALESYFSQLPENFRFDLEHNEELSQRTSDAEPEDLQLALQFEELRREAKKLTGQAEPDLQKFFGDLLHVAQKLVCEHRHVPIPARFASAIRESDQRYQNWINPKPKHTP